MDGVKSWIRTLRLVRGQEVVITEKYLLDRFSQPAVLSLMTPLRADASVPGKIVLADSREEPALRIAISYDAARFKVVSEKIAITDGRLKSVWGERIERIRLTAMGGSAQGEHELSIRYIR